MVSNVSRLRQAFKPVMMDADGVFKYIQIQLDMDDEEPYTIVRGWLDCPYHADILAKFNAQELGNEKDLKDKVHASCPGGGRIKVVEQEKTVHIYGYSQGFGRCDHTVSQKLVQESHEGYTVTWSNEGY